MVDDQIRLLVLQQQLEQEAAASGRPFVGLSVNATIRQCLLAGLDKKADKTRSDFKVPDKRCASGLSRLVSCAWAGPSKLTRLGAGTCDLEQVLVHQAARLGRSARLGRPRHLCAVEKVADRVRALGGRADPRRRPPTSGPVRRSVRPAEPGRAVHQVWRVGDGGAGMRSEGRAGTVAVRSSFLGGFLSPSSLGVFHFGAD